MKRALVLHSGGMDSTTALWWAGAHYDKVGTLGINYGSRHNPEELYHAALSQLQFKTEHPHAWIGRWSYNIQDDFFIGAGSTLMREGEIPSEEYHDPEKESPSSTVVPFRNGVLISLATAFAASHRFSAVIFAAHGNDAIGWAYPDCTPEFLGSMISSVYIGTMRHVRLVVPFQWSTKAGIVKQALELGVPLGLSYSCYRGRKEHCGECPTCRERIQAFKENNYVDPAVYSSTVTWSGCNNWPFEQFPNESLNDF